MSAVAGQWPGSARFPRALDGLAARCCEMVPLWRNRPSLRGTGRNCLKRVRPISKNGGQDRCVDPWESREDIGERPKKLREMDERNERTKCQFLIVGQRLG